jgi:hypothetical protein
LMKTASIDMLLPHSVPAIISSSIAQARDAKNISANHLQL